MADISKFLSKIKNAIYGEAVRGSIHDALVAINEESSSAKEVAIISQNSAQASATAASASASNAKTSETNAKTSETNAKTSETNAKESEKIIKQFALYLSFFDALREAVEACVYPSPLLDSDGNEIFDSDGENIITETKGMDGFRNTLINVPVDVLTLSQQIKDPA